MLISEIQKTVIYRNLDERLGDPIEASGAEILAQIELSRVGGEIDGTEDWAIEKAE